MTRILLIVCWENADSPTSDEGVLAQNIVRFAQSAPFLGRCPAALSLYYCLNWPLQCTSEAFLH